MKKMMNWVLAATFCICGASVFTSCTWKMTDDSDELREWWEIESISDGVMKWKALRLREDGSTYTATFQMAKVE